ncbi:MAG: SDR family NAD(P)-dependent oxidoreductase [Nocardioides sp.]|uniref:SDR family NAD(P)-dependent oxidoreductase n=1 Tax=Nocardioides sp. TaxID=35761 RepID=UPI0039E6E60E
MIEGRTAVVTGGASGLGAAVVRELAALGADVVIADRDLAGAEALAARLAGLPGEVIARHVDIAEDDSVRTLCAELAERECSILVANAGITRVERFVTSDPASWEQLYRVNQRGPMLLAHRLVPGMVERGWGRVVLVSSDGARAGSWGEAVYSATKSALFGFAKSLARETARAGVTVNVVCPGPMRTPMLERVSAESPSLVADLERAIPMRRLGEPEDVAGVIAFLAGDGASYLTGQVVSVSGGITMQ